MGGGGKGTDDLYVVGDFKMLYPWGGVGWGVIYLFIFYIFFFWGGGEGGGIYKFCRYCPLQVSS